MTDGDKELREKLTKLLQELWYLAATYPAYKAGDKYFDMQIGSFQEAILSAVHPYCEQREDRVYRQGRIAAIEAYLDVCNDEEVEPSYLTLEEYQRGQLHAFKDIYDTQSRQPGGEADKHASE